MEIKAKSKKEIGETARIVHKSYFDKTKYAIDNGFYLEALCMEYASMEGRMKVLMREMGMECGIKKSAKDHPDVPLKRRFVCLKRALFKHRKDVFEESYFNEKMFEDIFAWIDMRNSTMHALYNDTEKYDEMVKKLKVLALKGYDYVITMYDEANRLKRLMKKHPEYKEKTKKGCDLNNSNCKKLHEFLKNGFVIYD